jgi:hypothetical protein
LSENFLNTPKRVFNSENNELAYRIKKANIKSYRKAVWKLERFIKQERTTPKSVSNELISTQVFIKLAQSQKLNSSRITQRISTTEELTVGPENEWIVDLRENPSKRLQLIWKNSEAVLSGVEISSSMDLIHWKKHSSNQSLSNINQNGFKLLNNTLNIPSLKRFFRIRLVHQKARPVIEEINSMGSAKGVSEKPHKQKA